MAQPNGGGHAWIAGKISAVTTGANIEKHLARKSNKMTSPTISISRSKARWLRATRNLMSLGYLLLACSPVLVLSLDAQGQESQGQTHPNLILTAPAPLGGTSPQLLPTSESEVSNVISGGLTLGALTDDNATSATGQSFREYQYSVLPTLMLQQTRPYTTWTLDYRGGLTIDQGALGANPLFADATAATADVQHIFGRRLLLELRDDYVLTNNPFGYNASSPSLPALSGTGQLNSYAAVPLARRAANVSSADVTYQLTQHSSVGFSGGYSTQRFTDVGGTADVALALINTDTTTGRGFYIREISQHQKLGLEYQVQDLLFQGGEARTVDQTVFLFDQIGFTRNLTLTLFAGPDYAHVHNNMLMLGSNASTAVLVGINDLLSPAGGAVFTWRGKYAALSLSGQRVVTDGSGFAGALRATSASAELRKDFTSRWSASVGYSYSDGRVLEGPADAIDSVITFEQGSLAVERRLSKDFSARVQYSHIQQISAGTPAPLTAGDHNRVEVEVVYQFTRPWGR
jgi:hypothetical protein